MISKSGLHAIKALAVLARLPKGKYEGAVAIAREIGAPGNYLGKLLQDLTRNGLVTSQKGLGGGFRLAKDPLKISLYDIVEPIDQISRWNGCFIGNIMCSDTSACAVHQRWGAVRDAYLNLLKQTTINELVPGKDIPLIPQG